jgi:hypothetical protein
MKGIIGRQQFVQFHSMDEIPDVAKDLKGNKEPFSISVLAYDKELDLWTIAWYNFDTKSWMDHSEDSLKFCLWCNFPVPNNFLAKNHNKLVEVKNSGYIDGLTNSDINNLLNNIETYNKN